MSSTKRAVQAILIMTAATATTAAWAQGVSDPALFPGTCVAGQFSMGTIYFPNVGNKDRGEGAPNVIRISLCSLQPNRRLKLIRQSIACPGRVISQTRFQNVGRGDFNEGAPNFVTLQLCQTGPLPRRYQITTRGCNPGFRLTGNPLRFKNVGDNDRNKGAPNVITVSLCAN